MFGRSDGDLASAHLSIIVRYAPILLGGSCPNSTVPRYTRDTSPFFKSLTTVIQLDPKAIRFRV